MNKTIDLDHSTTFFQFFTCKCGVQDNQTHLEEVKSCIYQPHSEDIE